MAMNQPSPEILAQLMQMSQGQPPVEGARTPEEAALLEQEMQAEAEGAVTEGGNPQEPVDSVGNPSPVPMPPEGIPMSGIDAHMGMMSPQQQAQPLDIDPMVILPEVIASYMNYVLGIIKDASLDKGVQSKILVEQAQSLSSLVPLLKDDSQMMQMELMMKQQEMELKREEMQMNLQMKQEEMGMKQQEHSMKLQHSQAENQMKLRQQEETHAHKIVQSQQSHETKMEQQKQAAQSKQDSKPSSKQGGE